MSDSGIEFEDGYREEPVIRKGDTWPIVLAVVVVFVIAAYSVWRF